MSTVINMPLIISNEEIKGYDIIGDIHGHAEALVTLLAKLGYTESQFGFCHPERKAIFLGDLIDRGPEQVRVLTIVRAMVESGFAHCILGNHEFNAIGWLTKKQDGHGYLRTRNSKNKNQHAEFLSQVGEESDEHHYWVNWFKTLPIWLELPDIQVIHACWHPDSMQVIKPYLSDSYQLTDEHMQACFTVNHPAREALEILTKGLELPLPDGCYFFDKDGYKRTSTRVKWWGTTSSLIFAFMPSEISKALPEAEVIQSILKLAAPAKPTFIGHYWLKGKPSIENDLVACLDFSVAKDGALMAYKFDGEQKLLIEKLIPHK